MANNQDSEAFHEIPSSKCYYLGDRFGAVNKDFLKVFAPFFFFGGIIITLITEHTNLWYILAINIWKTAFVRGWFVTLPLIGVVIIALYIWHRKNQRKKLAQSEINARRRKLDQLIGGEKD